MGLKTYQAKRNFSRTREPRGKKPAASKRGLHFVVQKHAATRLHYDFRLELDGVLKSWAVPKGPSGDPATKRLAVQVEDHPIEYQTFEGTIPEGEYGGGTVMIWDRGTWSALEPDPAKALEKGKLKFALKGKRMQGAWALVRMGGRAADEGKPNWLLFKERDEFATPGDAEGLVTAFDESVKSKRSMDEIAGRRGNVWHSNRPARTKRKAHAIAGKTLRARKRTFDPEMLSEMQGAVARKMPAELRPELATLVDQSPAGDDWIHEIKFDGYRILAFISGKKVRLLSRRGNDWTDAFRSIATELAAMGLPDCILDGELVALNEDGAMNFQALQNVAKHGARASLLYYVFDLPYCSGRDLRRAPLLERKRVLAELLGPATAHARVRYCEHAQGGGPELFANACRVPFEGLVSKRADSVYQEKRTHDWLKAKCLNRQEFVIGGFTPPGGTRNHFGALLLGYHDDGSLKYAGKVGTGFDERALADIHAQLVKLKTAQSPFASITRADARHATWVKPQLLAEVSFTEWTGDGHLRHPSFHGLRGDKPATAVIKEKPVPAKAIEKEKKSTATPPSHARKSGAAETKVAGQRLTHPDRVLYPDLGITKQALAEYYEQIADWALPEMIDRPLSIVRCPEGVGQPCFFQKHRTEHLPDGIDSVRIREKSGSGDYLVIHDLLGLVGLVQIGALEIHPWGCRTDNIERPDRMIFDLDPDTAVEWDDVKAAALELRALLEAAGLECCLKTSGGKGLHVIVPLARRNTWDDIRAFSQGIAAGMARTQPTKYIANMSKAKRKGKVYVDYVRNSRGQTSIAPYSSRAREGAAVSVPIRWDELKSLESPRAFTVLNTPDRLKRLKKDPWAAIRRVKQSITKSLLNAIAE